MRITALVLAAACGSGNSGPKDGQVAGGSDSTVPTIDAPALQACTPTSGTKVSLRKIGNVTGSAVLAASPPNDGRLFVLEQDGRIRIFENEQLKATPFLDISNDQGFAAGGEQGLLGLAFHPKYAINNKFYIWYTTTNADVLAEYTASPSDPNVADPASKKIVLSIPDFASNHNGGMLEFGQDGYLYVGTGDGGGAGDPHRNGQAIDRTLCMQAQPQCEPLLGKILRIDVDHPANGKPYGIPADNPFAGGGGEPEIFIIGTRNPWRWSFDKKTWDLWIGDVGQSMFEEIDVLPAGHQAGVNLGWSMYEATSCYGNYPCDPTGKTMPQQQFGGTTGFHAIIGGEVYHGSCYPDLEGTYFFTDEVAHVLYSGKLMGTMFTGTPLAGVIPATGVNPSSLHGDARGELYMTTIQGAVYHLEAGP